MFYRRCCFSCSRKIWWSVSNSLLAVISVSSSPSFKTGKILCGPFVPTGFGTRCLGSLCATLHGIRGGIRIAPVETGIIAKPFARLWRSPYPLLIPARGLFMYLCIKEDTIRNLYEKAITTHEHIMHSLSVLHGLP